MLCAEIDGEVVGTACACVFDNVAWVNLVLVNQVHRGRGIGTSLMRSVLAYLDERKIPSIRLDATPLGRPIYEKLGFELEYELTRYEGMPALQAESWPANGSPSRRDGAAADHAARSTAITGTHRDKLISYLHRAADPLHGRR